MTSPVLWATIALLAMFGWSAFVILIARSVAPMANSLGILQKVDAVIDDRIRKTLEAIRSREDRRPNAPQTPAPTQGNAAHDALLGIFGGSPLEPVMEQPDSDMEVVG